MAETTIQKAYKEKAVAQQSTLPVKLGQAMAGLMPQIPALLPQDIPVEQFRAALYLELSGRPTLADCTQESLRDCVIKAAMYGLLPGRDCHMLPFKNRRGNSQVATYVPNYFGIITALERTGKVRRAFAHAVYSKDVFEVDYFADRPVHKPVLEGDRGRLRCFYGCIILKDGSCNFEVMTLEQVEATKARAPAHDQGPWVTDYEMMGRKTALKRVAKYVRLTPEQAAMLDEDAAREREDIPEDRHRKNIVDLFGKDAGPEEEPPPPPKNVTPPSAPPGKREGAAWDTLRSYQADPRVPEELLERIGAALGTLAPATDSEAHTLAGEILDYLAKAEE